MPPSFSHDEWTFEWSAAGVGPTVIFLSRSPLSAEGTTLAKALEPDYFVIRLQASGKAAKQFAPAVEAFFADRQLHRVHWVVAEDALDLLIELGELSHVIWSFTSEAKMPNKSFTLETETILRQTFAKVDKPYRTSEHPI